MERSGLPTRPSLRVGSTEMATCLQETDAAIEQAAAFIRAGRVIVCPTDTLYGLGADATNDVAVARLFAIKGRAETKPILVLVRDLEEAMRCGQINGAARALAAKFWPGPLTLVVERTADSPLSRALNPTGTTIGLRVPARAATLALIKAADRPLTAPSANRSGEAPALSAAEALAALGPEIAMALDGGPSAPSASTIVEVLGNRLRLIREGAIPRASLLEAGMPVET